MPRSGWSAGHREDAGYIDNVAGHAHLAVCEEAVRTTTSRSTVRAVRQGQLQHVETYGARAALRFDLERQLDDHADVMDQKQKSNGVFGDDPHGLGDQAVAHFTRTVEGRMVPGGADDRGKDRQSRRRLRRRYLDRQVDASFDYSDYSYFYDTCLALFRPVLHDSVGDPTIGRSITSNDGYSRSKSHELRISSPQDRRCAIRGRVVLPEAGTRLLQKLPRSTACRRHA